MTLPTHDEIQKILSERPGDDLYPEVKDDVDNIIEEEIKMREKLVSLIVKDIILDEAIAHACDKTGKILTYLSQQQQIEAPDFSGEMLMRNFSRISKLKLNLEYAKLIGLEGEVLDLCIKAEIERLWGDSNTALLKKMLLQKAAETTPSVLFQNPETGVKTTK